MTALGCLGGITNVIDLDTLKSTEVIDLSAASSKWWAPWVEGLKLIRFLAVKAVCHSFSNLSDLSNFWIAAVISVYR